MGIEGFSIIKSFKIECNEFLAIIVLDGKSINYLEISSILHTNV